MQFLSLLFLAPALISALPSITTRDDSVSKYTYTFPSEFLLKHPDVSPTITLDDQQLRKISTYVPIEIGPNNEVVGTGTVNVEKMADDIQSPDDEMSVMAPNVRCLTCMAACTILGVLGPEAILPCIALCATRSFCR